MRVLLVCTANICRSASAARLLVDGASQPPALDLEVRSAGIHAISGMPGCALAPALADSHDRHRSQQLTPDLVAWADLSLPAARDHRAAIEAMDLAAAGGRSPSARPVGSPRGSLRSAWSRPRSAELV